MDVLVTIQRLENAVHEPDQVSAVTDPEAAAAISDATDALANTRTDRGSDDTSSRLVQVGFRLASDRPEWTLTPVAAFEAFTKLIRQPRILAAYADGVPVEQIGSQHAIAKSSLYALLTNVGVAAKRSGSGRPRRLDHAAVRLEVNNGLSINETASLHGCSPRTVTRIVHAPRDPHLQAFIDRLSVVEPGEELRGAWNRYLDALARAGEQIAELGEPEWPADPERRALAAAAIAYQFHHRRIEEPDWLKQPGLVSPTITSPVPEYIDIVRPLTPAVVARYNVALDEDSFHSV